MRRIRVVMTRRARRDVRMIRDYIAERSPANADAFVSKLEREILELGKTHLHHAVTQLLHQGHWKRQAFPEACKPLLHLWQCRAWQMQA